jgi:WD40 repeat protein
VWDVGSGKILTHQKAHTGGVSAVAFTPDGRRFLSAGHDGRVLVWDPANGRAEIRLEGPRGAVRCLAVSPDRRSVLAGGDDKVLRLWQLPR